MVQEKGPGGKPLHGIREMVMIRFMAHLGKIMPLPDPSTFVSPPFEGSQLAFGIGKTKPHWITGLTVILVMATMGLVALVLALWTQTQRRARDLPPIVELPDRLAAKVALGGDLVVWARGDISKELASCNVLSQLFPFPMGNQKGSSVLMGWRELKEHWQLGMSLEWALGRNFEKIPSKRGAQMRLAVQLEKTPHFSKLAETHGFIDLGNHFGRFRLEATPAFPVWDSAITKGGLITSQWNIPSVDPVPFTQSGTDDKVSLAPDFLELRVSKIPRETQAWLMARGGAAAKEAAGAVLGPGLRTDAKEAVLFPVDPLVFGIWEEPGQLRAEWIFAEPGPSLAWERALQKADLGPAWKWIKQGKVVSLQWQKNGLFSP